MANLNDSQVRRWLSNFHVPERLADPPMRDLLRAHGRPADGSTVSVARQAAALLRDGIEALAPAPEAPRHAWRPFFVLVVSYVQAGSLETTGARLDLSTRQVSRERTRAIHLLRTELEAPPAS